MADLLTKLLQANLAIAAAILLVLLLRQPCRRLFGAPMAYALWLLAPLTAAASLAPPRPAELLPAPPLAPVIGAAEQAFAQAWTWNVATAPTQGPLLDPAAICFWLWLAGALAMIGWLAMRQVKFGQALAHRLAGPAVIGVLKPRIVTPADFGDRFDSREQALVLAHERIHLARHDTRINALVALARCLCWFNPLVHLAAHLMRIDQELACDAAVVARHPRARAPYAQALLKAQLATVPLPLGCYWPAGGEHPLTNRIAMLDSAAPSRARRIAGGALIALLAAGTGYAAWAAAPATAPMAEAPAAYLQAALAQDAEPAHVTPPPTAPVSQPAPKPTAAPAADVASEPRIDPADVDDQGRPKYGQPFVRRYDGNASLWLNGVIVRLDYLNPNTVAWVYGPGFGKDGAPLGKQLWRVDGGTWLTLSPEQRAEGLRSVGREVSVRGYQTKDKACAPTCRLNGREVIFTNGEQFFANAGGKPDCTFEEVRSYSCPGSEKASFIPAPPTAQEIAQALAKGGKRAAVESRPSG